MASKSEIAGGEGVIDAEYSSEVKVILRNHGQVDCSFKSRDQIAQLIVESIAEAGAMEVDDLGTRRGENWVSSHGI